MSYVPRWRPLIAALVVVSTLSACGGGGGDDNNGGIVGMPGNGLLAFGLE